MPALVPYKRALALGTYALPSKRARLAYTMASHVYNNRKRYARAARVIGRAYRSYKKRRIGMNRIDVPKRAASAKKDETVIVNQSVIASRTLYSSELTNIPRGSNNEINLRQRDQIYYAGSKICVEIQPVTASVSPIYFNMAVVYDKRTNDVVTTVDTEDFFRGVGVGSRSQDFDPNGLTGMEFHCLPLNTDRFTVLKHKRIMMNGNSDGLNYKGTNYRFFQMYVPIKKRIAYEDGNCQSKIHVLWWCSRFNTLDSDGPEATMLRTSIRAHTYFRDTK